MKEKRCDVCKGRGIIELLSSSYKVQRVPCPYCRGKGRVKDEG